jgi:hypothetical protein
MVGALEIVMAVVVRGADMARVEGMVEEVVRRAI